MDLAIRAGRVITPNEELGDSVVAIDKGRIVSVEPRRNEVPGPFDHWVDASQWTLVPGFVDIQVNGALGCSFSQACPEKREEIYRYFLARGTTTLLPTLFTDAPELLVRGLSALAGDVGHTENDRPEIPGLHLEGPFINVEQRGAHPQEHIRLPDLDLAAQFWEAAHGRIAIVTLAPELEGAEALIRWFGERGVVVSAGHTSARCSTVLEAGDMGVTLLTHMGNASDWPYRRRNKAGILASEPGVVGAFLISDRLRGSVILDGYHFDPRLAYALCRARGPENVVLISDASFATGCPPGDYDDGVMPTTVHKDHYAFVSGGGGWLAGSVITLARAVRVAVRQGGVRLRDAIEMVTSTPAEVVGLAGSKGRIEPGYDADLALLDGNLHVKRVIRAGREVAGSDVD